MGIETPNLLSRETTFLMGILKKCLSVETVPNKPNDQISSLSVSGHSVPPTEADPLTPAEADPNTSTEGVFSHSVPLTEDTAPLTSTDRSQMNCASISDTAETSDSSSVRVVGSNNHSLSINGFTSHTRKGLKLPMQTYSKVLVNSQGEPYKLRLKPDAVPAKTQTKESSCTSPRCLP